MPAIGRTVQGGGSDPVAGRRAVREPIAWHGPFVMNSREELVEAIADFRAGRLGTIPAVHHTPRLIVEAGGQTSEEPE